MTAITTKQKQIISRVINTFETGHPDGDYSSVTIYKDGKNNSYQITYGRSQTTQAGDNLGKLIRMYIAENGMYSGQFSNYLGKTSNLSLHRDTTFTNLLKKAGKDPVMQKTQDEFFDKRYFVPAENWWSSNGFALPLSLLVAYDSFIHSGGIKWFLRRRFSEKTPADGGSEKIWIDRYVDARHQWLKYYTSPGNPEKQKLIRNTTYRTRCLKNQIEESNWNLNKLPINANGTLVDIPSAG